MILRLSFARKEEKRSKCEEQKSQEILTPTHAWFSDISFFFRHTNQYIDGREHTCCSVKRLKFHREFFHDLSNAGKRINKQCDTKPEGIFHGEIT